MGAQRLTLSIPHPGQIPYPVGNAIVSPYCNCRSIASQFGIAKSSTKILHHYCLPSGKIEKN